MRVSHCDILARSFFALCLIPDTTPVFAGHHSATWIRLLRIKVRRKKVMAIKPLQVISIDCPKGDIFVLSFSDDTTAILTAQELAEYFADRRIAVRGFEYMLSA
jgi:hypothetical protein